MKKVTVNKSVSFTPDDMELLDFAVQQEIKFSPYIKELLKREQASVRVDEKCNCTEILNHILMLLLEIKQELGSSERASIPITNETSTFEHRSDTRDLSGLTDF